MNIDPLGSECTRHIRATYNDTTVRVYQAYNEAIAKLAVETQSFQAPQEAGIWSSTRMTWIKPSKVWMAYRCGWTVLKDSNQARVLALDIDRTYFEEILLKAYLSHEMDGLSKKKHPVVVQWDPERVMDVHAETKQVFTKSTPYVRSIQIGLRSPANECLLDRSVVKRITDVTVDFQNALQALKRGNLDEAVSLLWPEPGEAEKILQVSPAVQSIHKMTEMKTNLALGNVTSTSTQVNKQ